MANPVVYRLCKLQGDYALLQIPGMEDTILVARAFLPEEADEGDILVYEDLSYRLAGAQRA